MGPSQCNRCKKPATAELKLKLCAGCSEVGYCSKECQKEDWKEHKKVCKKVHKRPAAQSANPHLADQNAKEVPVVWEDQQRINMFGRLNNRAQEIDDEIKAKKDAMAGLVDAAGEIEMLLDDDCCKIRVGDLFVQVTNEEAEEYAAQQKEEREAELAALTEEKAGLVVEMKKLKAILYAKFGGTINLETDKVD